MKNAIIYDAIRTPRGRGKNEGGAHTLPAIELVKRCLISLRERNNLEKDAVEDVILGVVTPIGEQGGNIAKIAALYAGYDQTTCGVTLNRFCASGLEAIFHGAGSLISGITDLVVAGGVESMSRVPMGSDGGAWFMDPSVALELKYVPQGVSADLIATLAGINRSEADQWAVRSHKRAFEAWDKGYFKSSVIPVLDEFGKVVLAQDENIRGQTTEKILSALSPSFLQWGEVGGFDAVARSRFPQVDKIHHIHHAGNSSAIVDGAAAVLLGSEEVGKKYPQLRARGQISAMALTGTDPTLMLQGPGPATKKLLAKAGRKVEDIDLFEVNEAFSAVVLKFMQDLKVPEEKVNVCGGAIAMGHPLGATGAMLVGTLLDELERRDKSCGVVTLCVGGGMGVSCLIDRIN